MSFDLVLCLSQSGRADGSDVHFRKEFFEHTSSIVRLAVGTPIGTIMLLLLLLLFRCTRYASLSASSTSPLQSSSCRNKTNRPPPPDRCPSCDGTVTASVSAAMNSDKQIIEKSFKKIHLLQLHKMHQGASCSIC